jgi:hypothetical protein
MISSTLERDSTGADISDLDGPFGRFRLSRRRLQ